MGSLIDTSVLAGARDVSGIADGWTVSVVTVGELEAGVLIAGDEATRARRVALLAAVLDEAPALPIDRHIVARYGELRATAGDDLATTCKSLLLRWLTTSRSSPPTSTQHRYRL